MQKNINEYQLILENLKKKSFTGLKNKKIFIFESSLISLKGMALRPLPHLNVIILNKDVRDKDIDYKIGLLVHEISHIDLYQKISWFKYLYEGFLYLTSKKFRSKNEWETEMHAIKKGYVNQVCHYSKEREEFRIKYGYMTSKAINEYANSLKN
jgi:hypothetical protein